MNTRKQQQGFTIIEVVLVLAIAALIFLMIFVALPALQASQRDTARKNDASIVSSGVTKYVSAKRTPVTSSTANSDLQAYVEDLDQYDVTNVVIGAIGATPTANQVLVVPSAQCDGDVAATSNGNARKAAVVLLLDNQSNTYCVDAS